MTAPSLTYTLTNGSTADASQVMQNLNDLLNGISDGTKDLSISALTCAGTATLNGNVNLGNSSARDVTFTGSLASTIPIKTTSTYNIGSSTLGLAGVYFGANSQTVRIVGSGSMSATWTLTLPVNAGTAGYMPETNGSGVLTWRPHQTDIHSVSSDDYTVLDTDGYGTILVTTGSSDRTITLPTAADNTDRVITIQKIDTGTGGVIIEGEGAETIHGETNITLALQWHSTTLICNGTGWYSREGYFNSFRSTTAPTDAGTSPTGSVVHVVRKGQEVCVYGEVTTGSGSPTGDITWAGIIPTWGRPTSDDYVSVSQASTGSDFLYFTLVGTSGRLNLLKREIDNATDALAVSTFTTSALVVGRASYLLGE